MKIFYIVNWPYHEHRDMKRPLRRKMRWVPAKVDFGGDD